MKKIDLDVIKEEIKKSSKETEFYIGTDSQRYKKGGKWYAKYARCFVIHRDGKHGGSIYGDIESEQDFGQMRVRLMNEVQKTVDLALAIIPMLDGRRLHIHLDLNSDEKHASNIVMKEAVGWVWGATGIKPEVKPNAFVATHAADNYCH